MKYIQKKHGENRKKDAIWHPFIVIFKPPPEEVDFYLLAVPR